MSQRPRITTLDHSDPRVRAAEEAERHLLAHYGLPFTVRIVQLERPALRVRVLDVGAGAPVLVVPGGSGDAVWFAPLLPYLPGRRFLLVNRPGGGMSDFVDHRQVNLRRLAVDTLTAVLDACGVERAPVIGNSMGGLWAFWLALDRPDRVSEVIQLGCPGLILETSVPLPMRLVTVPLIGRAIVRAVRPRRVETALDVLRLIGTEPNRIREMPRAALEAAYHFPHLPTFDDTWMTLLSAVVTLRGSRPAYRLGSDQLRQVRQPVLFIWGARDPFGSLAVARRAADAVPDARLREVPTGHAPFLDDPEGCGRMIQEFLGPPGVEGPRPPARRWADA